MKHLKFLLLILSFSIFSVHSKTWNDVSRLNSEEVSTIVKVRYQDDVVSALKNLPQKFKVTISGTRHSQGGHIVYPNAIVLDMTSFNKVVSISPKEKMIVVQSGATWVIVQEEANKFGLAVKVMQSSNIFSVGGSLSANVHGRDPRFGPLIETVRSIKIALANGEVVLASRTVNPDLFFAAIGGYGLLGVILEAEIELTDNQSLEKVTRKVSVQEYADALMYQAHELSLHYGRCSFVPGRSFLTECYSTNLKTNDLERTVSDLKPEQNIKRNSLLFSASRVSDLGKATRWKLQKELLDKPGQVSNIERNPAMQPAVRFLEYSSSEDTDILQEYFIPIEKFSSFFGELSKELERYEVNLLSITLRYLKENHESYLAYAIDDMIAVVLYINIGLNDHSIAAAREWTRKLVDISLKHKGTYYLTYQRFPSLEQFQLTYPRWEKFMDVKCKYDPDEIFSSKFYEQYLRAAYKKRMQLDKVPPARPLCR